MSLTYTLRVRDGRLFIVGKDGPRYNDKPEVRYLWWPVHNQDATSLGLWNLKPEQLDGQALSWHGAGGLTEWCEIIERAFPRIRFILEHGGRTPAEFIEREAMPCPKVRKGIEVRWSSRWGAWEKYLKTKGWVVIYTSE